MNWSTVALVFSFAVAQFAQTASAADASKDYPVRPVRLVNPFPPGGSSDPICDPTPCCRASHRFMRGAEKVEIA